MSCSFIVALLIPPFILNSTKLFPLACSDFYTKMLEFIDAMDTYDACVR